VSQGQEEHLWLKRPKRHPDRRLYQVGVNKRDLPARWYISSVPNMTPAASDLHILPRDPLDPEALFLLREAAVEAGRLYAEPDRPGSANACRLASGF